MSLEESFLKAAKFAVSSWRDSAFEKQQKILFNPERWIKYVPDKRTTILALGSAIDRSDLRTYLATKPDYASQLVAIMIWGYGRVGYGPYRVKQMLDFSRLEQVMKTIAEASANDDFLGAYDALASGRVPYLGPAFGTKVISFIFQETPGVPILDSVVANYLAAKGTKRFEAGSKSLSRWNPKFFEYYVQEMRAASRCLKAPIDTLEYAMFRLRTSK